MKTELPPRHAIPSFWNRDKNQICLHLGENPFPPTPNVIKAITNASLYSNRYPDTNAMALRQKLADYVGNGIKPENILVGNGSDELIDLAVVTFAEPGKSVATFIPSFFVYSFAAQRHGLSSLTIPRDENYNLPPVDSLPPIDEVCLSFIANPNNPTGLLSDRDSLVSLIQALPGIVVVDECYFEFSEMTLVDLIPKCPNLVLFRSLSKSFGLAGLRAGYAIAQEHLIDQMGRSALTFPVNAIAQAAAIAALGDAEIYHERVRNLIAMRDHLTETLQCLGIEVLPSHTNFILTLWQLGQTPASRLVDNGIWISDQTQALNSRKQAIRIAVGTEEENQKLLDCIAQMYTGY